MELSIVPENLAAIQAAFASAPDIMLRHLSVAIDEGLLLAQREIAERTPAGAHQLLRKSILAGEAVEYAHPVPGGVMGVVGTSINYAVPVELGTSPHFPPLAPLEDWAIAKLGMERTQAKSVAWAIAKKIATVGTDGAFMFRDGFAAVNPYIQTRLAKAVDDALAEIAGQA
ncbi:MAG: hypothetical protein PHR16_11770 [Methylovulum sp.]|nr:hypothetical protein [Methylovulum sp.]